MDETCDSVVMAKASSMAYKQAEGKDLVCQSTSPPSYDFINNQWDIKDLKEVLAMGDGVGWL